MCLGHVGRRGPFHWPWLSGLDRGQLSQAPAARRWEETEPLYGTNPVIWKAGVTRMSPGSQLCIWQQFLWARPGQQPRLSLPTVALLIPEKRKPWGRLDQASAKRMPPFLCSAGSQTHGINSSETGSPLGGLGNLPRGHMAQDTLFFVTAAWLGGPRTSADKDASGAPWVPWKLMKEPLSSPLCPQQTQLTWSLGRPTTWCLTVIHSRDSS